jgi:O-antigen ligase
MGQEAALKTRARCAPVANNNIQEGMTMRWLFILLIWVLIVSDILGREFTLGPGLSAKNAFLYLIAFTMFFRFALSGELRLRLPILHAAFAVWIIYSLLSFFTCWVILEYPFYNALISGMEVKAELIDPALFCFTVFHATRTDEDFNTLNRTLAAAIGVSSLATLLDVAGVMHLGVRIGTTGAEADRVFGVFGHANETGALLVGLLPMLLAVALSSRGPARVAWFGGALASLAVLVLTVSRGAFVGFGFGYACACFICRRYLPLARVASMTLSGLAVGVVLAGVVTVVMPGTLDVVSDRLFGHSSLDMTGLSSGRTNIWASTIGYMIDEPITLLTGFGWNVQEQRFAFATHNYYINLWFNLGVIGLGAFLMVLYQCVAACRKAADYASPEMRRYMLACVFGTLGVAVSVFFTNLSKPWPYIWIYIGITLSAAARILESGERAPVALAASPPSLAGPYQPAPRVRHRSATGAS